MICKIKCPYNVYKKDDLVSEFDKKRYDFFVKEGFYLICPGDESFFPIYWKKINILVGLYMGVRH